MIIKHLSDCSEFTANDGCRIRELLHPKNDAIELPFSLAIAVVDAGQRTYKHKLDRDERYYILSGKGEMHIDDESSSVVPDDLVHIPANAIQWIENTGNEPLRFMAIVNPPWDEAGDLRVD